MVALSVSETKTVFLDYAKQVGLDLIRLEADLNSKEVDDKIKADLVSANQAGVNATPLFSKWTQGRVRTESEFNKTIEDEINKNNDNTLPQQLSSN